MTDRHRRAARSPPSTPPAPSTPTGHVVVDGNRIAAVGAGPAPRGRPRRGVRRRHRLPGSPRGWSTPTTTSTSGRPAGSRSRRHAVRLAHHALPGVGRHRRGRRAHAARPAALGWLAPHRLHDHAPTTTTCSPRDGGDLLGRRDRGRPPGRAAVPPDPRLDGPRAAPGRAAAGLRRGGPIDASSPATAEAIDRYHDPSPDSMLRIAVAPCSPFSVTAELMREAAALARDKGVRLHTHLAETLDEEDFCRERFGCSPVEYVERLGWLGPDVWLAHGVHLDDPAIRRARRHRHRRGALPVLQRPARRRASAAPADLLDAGVPVGLGVDGAASNEAASLLEELRARGALRPAAAARRRSRSATALALATIGGARVLGRDDRDRLAGARQARRPRAVAGRRARPRRHRRPGRRAGARLAAPAGAAAGRRPCRRRGRRVVTRRRGDGSRPTCAPRRGRCWPGRRGMTGHDDRAGDRASSAGRGQHGDRAVRTAAGSATARPRPDGTLKVTGEFAYSTDLWMDGMLWGATLRSPHPHARILGIDITAALAAPGVFAVLTHEDVPGDEAYGLEHPTSRCSPSTWSATRASRSRWSPPTTRRRPGGPPTGSSSTTRCSSRSPTPSRRWTRTARRLHPHGNVVRHVKVRKGDPDATADVVVSRRLRGRHAGPGVPRARVRPRGAGRATAASTSTSPPSGCTSTSARSARPSACPPTRSACTWPASAAPSAAARTCRCRCTPACSRCTPASR